MAHRSGAVVALMLQLWFAPSQFAAAAAFLHDYYRWEKSTVPTLCTSLPMSDDALSPSGDAISTSDTNPSEEPQRKRRQRYQGRYPRNFKEKYKELRGDDSTIHKVLQKGMTPAGTHVPIMLNECLHYMGIKSMRSINNNEEDDSTQDQNIEPKEHQNQLPALVVDCTLGYGGHSSHLIEAILLRNKQIRDDDSVGSVVNANENALISQLVAFDQDAVELKKTDERLRAAHDLQHPDNEQDQTNSNVFTTVHQNFCTLGKYLERTGETGRVTNLLADLGLSSMQIDDNERGFTYKREGPLDMRMYTNVDDSSETTDTATSSTAVTSSEETAYDLLCRLKPKQLKSMLEENSDEVYATEIANGLLLKNDPKKKKNQKKASIPKTTTELADRVRAIVEPLMQEAEFDRGKAKNSNNVATAAEIKVPKANLDSTVARVMQAIRIELNGEFRVLEQLLYDLPTILAPGGRAVFLTFHSGEDRRVKKAFKSGFKSGIYSSWSRDVVRPTAKERRDNPRSSCCKLRWVVRSNKPI